MTFAPSSSPQLGQPVDPARLPISSGRWGVGKILALVGVGLLVLLLPVASWFAIGNPLLAVVGGFMALFPLAFVVWVALAIDRWEPEPWLALLFAGLWGATLSIILTLLMNSFLLEPIVGAYLSQPGVAQGFIQLLNPMFAAVTDFESLVTFYQTVLQAPFTEELWKAVPVLVMYFFVRKHFDGPVDGIVIASLSAAGFAYTENIQYFGRVIAETGDPSFIFFLRGVMSPLTHAIFASLGTGLVMGLTARFLSSRLWGLLTFPLGWAISAAFHALWNGSSFAISSDLEFFAFYLLVQVPILIAAVLLVLLLRRFERRITHMRLDDYANAGWFSLEETDRLATSDGRAALLDWAKPRRLKKAMVAYIRTTTRLALNRQRAVTGREKLRPVADEAKLLGDVAALRQHMALVSGAQVQQPHGTPLPAVGGHVGPEQRFAGGFMAEAPQHHTYPQP